MVDPDLSETARRLLEETERQPHWYDSVPLSLWRSMVPSPLRCGAAVLVGAGVWWITGEAELGLLDAFHSLVLPVAVGALALHMVLGALETTSHNRTVRVLAEARKRRVQPTELNDDARTLMARAQQAQRTVLTSSVHRSDLIDRQYNELALPQQEWEIAEALREYSRLANAEPEDPRGSEVAALLGIRRKALRTSLDGIARRVLALETYADQVTEADNHYRELQQIQQLANGNDDVLDFIARTARDDLAVAEIEGTTKKAVAIRTAFNCALDSAKEAAVIALPARKTA
ncbi:hypothetical protein [Streptomyces sp. NPDC087298]|uniref:hypothetical protein n=1 Tax=Streptomyces sp. NPDC087298 TaxID=3365779 RepID=UPI003815389D